MKVIMFYMIGEYHQVKNKIGRFLRRNEWVEIIGRQKIGKDTIVSIKDKNGNNYHNVNVKKLRRKAR